MDPYTEAGRGSSTTKRIKMKKPNFAGTKWSLLIAIGILYASLVGVPGWGNWSQEPISTASLLTLETGIRPVGMGEAFTAIEGDHNALLHNPAGLTSSKTNLVTSSCSQHYGEFSTQSLTLGTLNMAMKYLQLSSETIKTRNSRGRKTGTMQFKGQGLVAGWGTSFSSLSVGVQAKYYSQLEPSAGHGGSISPGLLYSWKDFSFGLVLENAFSIPVTYRASDHTEGWQRNLEAGFAYSTPKFSLTIDLADGLNSRGLKSTPLQAGFEGKWFQPVTFRFGISSEWQTSLGFTCNFDPVEINYAYLIHNHLPSVHKISFGVSPSLMAETVRSIYESHAGVNKSK